MITMLGMNASTVNSTCSATSASQPHHASPARWRVLAFFSLGFLVSYIFRGVNLGFAQAHLGGELTDHDG